MNNINNNNSKIYGKQKSAVFILLQIETGDWMLSSILI